MSRRAPVGSDSPYLLNSGLRTMDGGWSFPFRLEHTADAYLFCWGRVRCDRSLRRTTLKSDPYLNSMRRAAATDHATRFGITVGLEAAYLAVKSVPGYAAAEASLDLNYAGYSEAFHLPDWGLEPVQHTFDRWRQELLPPVEMLLTETLVFRQALQGWLDTHPQDPRLFDAADPRDIHGVWSELERVQYECLRDFRGAVRDGNLKKAEKAWKQYQRIVDRLREKRVEEFVR